MRNHRIIKINVVAGSVTWCGSCSLWKARYMKKGAAVGSCASTSRTAWSPNSVASYVELSSTALMPHVVDELCMSMECAPKSQSGATEWVCAQ